MAKIPNKTIAEVSVVPVHLLQDMMVNDLVDVSGQWNLPMLDSWMPQHVSDILLAMLPPAMVYGEDNRVWNDDSNGIFFLILVH
jgi:hypothetical protein